MLFYKGAQFPPEDAIPRLAKQKAMRKLFQGKQYEVYDRASLLLKDTPHAHQLNQLYVAVNLADILVTKPADLLVGEPPQYDSGLPDDSDEQKALNSYVEENDINQLIHESAVGNGYRGDAWVKVRYGYRQDLSEVRNVLSPESFAELLASYEMEPIIEHVNALNVFPEVANGNVKQFKAVNIASVEWVMTRKEEKPFLNVERHIPGFIMYERFALTPLEVDNSEGFPIETFRIGDKVSTGREDDIVATNIPHMPVFHVPYKSVDDDWQGVGGLEKIAGVIYAIEDRLAQIDYILWKHSDPTAYGPDLDMNQAGGVQFSGKYIPVTKEDVTPGYMVWSAQLEAAFKQLDLLLGIVYQMSETPQWLFGTTTAEDKGGSGTSHTDGVAIKARFMPIISKVSRIRTHYDKAIRDALWTCMLFDIEFGDLKVKEAVYPKIHWQDGLPKNDKELAEIMSIRSGGKATIDVHSAIKKLDDVNDIEARKVVTQIDSDEVRVNGFVDSTVFNEDES
jgi:hypothetical protein